jgi:hypothetical protein
VSAETRELYASPQGDRWFLAREKGTGDVFVVHLTEASAGGRVTQYELGAFLSRDGGHPEQQALIRLIGKLTEGFSDGP